MNDRRGVYIPPEIWNLDGLSIPERIVLAEIAFLASNGRCFASNDHFGRLLGCSASNARKMVYKLIESEFVVRVSKSGHEQRVLCPNPNAVHVQNWTTPCPKPDTIENNRENKPKKQQRATRPNLDMCVEWFSENGFPQYAEPFFDYYETNGWVQGGGKKPIRNWEAAARGWVRRQKQYNDEKRQRGFDKLKFNADNIKSWANQKNDGRDVGR